MAEIVAISKRLAKGVPGLAVFILAVFVCSGCMVGPDYERPITAADINDGFYNASDNVQEPNEFEVVNRWWEHFGDPITASLVELALAGNYDLKAAAARCLQAQAAFNENSGRRMPSVSYNLGYDRSKRSFKFGSERFESYATTFSHDISISYVLDLFGKLKHNQRAAWSNFLSAQASQHALTNTVIAGVIIARIDIATLEEQLAIARATSESRQRTLEIVERRYSQGLVGPVDVRLARENLAAAKSLEPALESSLITAQHALGVLIARRPGSMGRLPDTLPELPDLEPVNIGLPASLLDRRPDVMASEHALQATNELIGVSIAQLYPDLNFAVSGGMSADRWRDIWKDETEVYGAVFRLAQPIFTGGQLQAQIDGAKARFEEAAANYARTVLVAMKEVEDALVREEMLQRQLVDVETRLREATAAEDLSTERYQRGVETILTVLVSERGRRLAETELAILKGRIWSTRVNLLLALGGDWVSQTDKYSKQD